MELVELQIRMRSMIKPHIFLSCVINPLHKQNERTLIVQGEEQRE